jgi:hypothetical protein
MSLCSKDIDYQRVSTFFWTPLYIFKIFFSVLDNHLLQIQIVVVAEIILLQISRRTGSESNVPFTLLSISHVKYGLNKTLDFIEVCVTLCTSYFAKRHGITVSPFSGWLRTVRPRGRRSGPTGVKNFHVSISFRPTIASTQLPIRWLSGALCLRKVAGAWNWPPTPN